MSSTTPLPGSRRTRAASGSPSNGAGREHSTSWWARDGLHSNIRSLAFGADSEFVRDLGCYAAIFRTVSHLDLEGWELMYSMPGKNGLRGKTVGLYPLPNRGEAIAIF